MKSVKSVYMFTDLEGVAGIDDWDPRRADYGMEAKGVYERSEMQRLLTGEVNAAAEGLFAAGVAEVLVNDSHGPGRTILVEDLVPGVKIARGTGRQTWMLGLSPRFDALIDVGMHAMAGTPNACLCHTQMRGLKFRVNGREFGEMEQTAYLAGMLGIPWIFTSGDLYACREAEEWVPGMVTAPVKEGLGLQCAIHLAPTDARKLIRETVQQAVAKAGEFSPLRIEGPATMEVEWEEPWPAALRYGAERVDAFTIRYTGPDIWSVIHDWYSGNPNLPLPD